MTDIAAERRRLADVGLTHRLREQWGARFNYRGDRAVTTPASRLFLHITITNPRDYPSNDAHARGVEAIGISRFPATGLSYNELLLPGGHLYEGQPLTRRGAHTVNDKGLSKCATPGCPGRGTSLLAPSGNLNINARAISLARNVADPVTDADVQAAARWGAALKLARYATSDARWHGHRCVSAKSCPGDRGWTRLDDISDLTATYVRNGLPGTRPTRDWFDMASKAELEQVVEAALTKKRGEYTNGTSISVGSGAAGGARYAFAALAGVQALTKLVIADSNNDITQEQFEAAHDEILAALEAEEDNPPTPNP